MIKKCKGCGIKLQTENENEQGYIPNKDKDYCMRCYRLTHYNDMQNNIDIKNQDILKKLATKKGICFFICDVFNINKETFSYYKQIKMPKVLVISKIDIIQKHIALNKIANHLINNYNIKDQIFFVSVFKNYGLKNLLTFIQSLNETIYFCGMTNAGKSSILNALFSKGLTVSSMPNTTLDFVKVEKNIYDFVGLNYQKPLPQNLLKYLKITKAINPKIMPLKENADLLINDLMIIDSNIKNTFTVFASTSLEIKKIYNKKHDYYKLEPLLIDVPKESNLIFKGLIFIYIKNKCYLKIYTPYKELIEIDKSFVKGEVNNEQNKSNE